LITLDIDLAAASLPFITATVAAYGSAVLDKIKDAAADSTADAAVGTGRRILRRLLGRPSESIAIEGAIVELAEDPGEADRVAALRLQIRKAIAADPELADDLERILGTALTIGASGPGSLAVHTNSGIIQTGLGSSAWQGPRPDDR
jgi:hypothetical protein